MGIAIPYQQQRVSPVFDVAASLLIIDIEKGQEVQRNTRTVFQYDSLARAQ
jgi:hypothetical protein